MKHKQPIFLTALGIVNSLGIGKAEVWRKLLAGDRSGLKSSDTWLVDGGAIFVGQVKDGLPSVAPRLSVFASRNLAMLITAVEEIREDIENAISCYGAERVAVVMGSSTSGIAEGEAAVRFAQSHGGLPDGFDIRKQELGSASEALAQYFNLRGPALTISTACSSGAQALAAGRRLIRTGVADAVIAGGADSLCKLTVNGFQALSALSQDICNPFSRNRDGTTLAEGAAVFLMDSRESEIELMGTGSSSDAFSMTAPEPDGHGVEAAVRAALTDACVAASDIDYVQLHGTGTLQNDEMESKVITRVFGHDVPCSSSKGQIGHTLGAAGAMGAAICWMAASKQCNPDGLLPPHVWDGEGADELLNKNLVASDQSLPASATRAFMSNAFGFGGNNAALIIGRHVS